MNLKELIKEIEQMQEDIKYLIEHFDDDYYKIKGKLEGIKQTVEAVDKIPFFNIMPEHDLTDWQKLKKLLNIF